MNDTSQDAGQQTANLTAKKVLDCVVIGSGFGGSVVACRLAEHGRTLVVLERGDAYPPGSFARTPLEVSTNFWDPSRNLFGLMDIWSFRKFDSIISSGLGGGSLIYANVLLRKPAEWFSAHEGWPVDRAALDPHYEKAEKMLGRAVYPYSDTTLKTKRFRDAARAAGQDWRPAPLAISFSQPGQPLGMPVGSPADNLHGVPRTTCVMCGACDAGCNVGAKNTLDLTYLSDAVRHGAVLRTLHEVRRIVPLDDGGGYRVSGIRWHKPKPPWVRDTSPQFEEFEVLSRTVVVAAGSYGSTYLLLHNRVNLPRLSNALGTRFSCNGDYLGFITGSADTVLEASRAPVITGYVLGHDGLERDPSSRTEPGFLLEDGGYPIAADWLGETLSPRAFVRLLRVATNLIRARVTGSARSEVSSRLTEAIGTARLSRSTLPMLGMGRDDAAGRMVLRAGDLDIEWSAANSAVVFRRIRAAMTSLARDIPGVYRDGPSALLSRFVTVHPLGGCPMATRPEDGVVDDHGEVFAYPGLFVVDGSVMPGPVGTNPSLTIAALAERFCDRILLRSNG